MLLKAGADVNVADTLYGKTPLHWAADNGKFIFRILKSNSKVCYIKLLLRNFNLKGCDKVVEFLLKNGADVNLKDKYDRTPMDVAVHTRNYWQ